jgi:hypothetical protein
MTVIEVVIIMKEDVAGITEIVMKDMTVIDVESHSGRT